MKRFLLVALIGSASLAADRESAVVSPPCANPLGGIAAQAGVTPSFRRQGDTVTLAKADLSRDGVALVFPEVTYRPGKLVAPDHKPTGELVDLLKKSQRFRGAESLALEELSVGGMAYAFRATYRQDGQTKVAVVKVFDESRPFFSDDAAEGKAPETIALMIQRQLGLYRYLEDRVAAEKEAKPSFNVEVAKLDLEPSLLERGVFVQDLAEGNSGQGIENLNEPGFQDLRSILHRDQQRFLPGVSRYFGARNPKYKIGGGERFLDESNDYSNFHWVGGYKPPDYEEVEVKKVTLIDW